MASGRLPSSPSPHDRLAVVGATFREVGFERLGDLVLPPDDLEGRRRLADALGAEELVYLSTCNRVECYVALAPGTPAGVLPARLASFMSKARGSLVQPDQLLVHSGRGALVYLMRVASALESLVLGETEVSGQARRALEQAEGEGLAGPALRAAFERASACSRRVRVALELDRGSPASAAELAVQKIQEHFGAEGPRVSVLLGVGPMTHEVAKVLQRAPGERLFVNRTESRAADLAARYGGRALSLEAFHRDPPGWIDLVFTATSAPAAVVRPAELSAAVAARAFAGVERPLIVCDLGVPRDVDPACDAMPGVLVVALEHMAAMARERRGPSAAVTARVDEIVAEEVARHDREERFRAIADQSARAMLDSRLAHLCPADRDQILRYASGLAERFARQPATLAPAADAERREAPGGPG